MSDRAEDLRNEAAQCLAQAQTTADPRRRAELVRMAARFHELASSVSVDFDAILRAYNDQKMVLGEFEPRVQQTTTAATAAANPARDQAHARDVGRSREQVGQQGLDLSGNCAARRPQAKGQLRI
jgi:hypothetical protein